MHTPAVPNTHSSPRTHQDPAGPGGTKIIPRFASLEGGQHRSTPPNPCLLQWTQEAQSALLQGCKESAASFLVGDLVPVPDTPTGSWRPQERDLGNGSQRLSFPPARSRLAQESPRGPPLKDRPTSLQSQSWDSGAQAGDGPAKSETVG